MNLNQKGIAPIVLAIIVIAVLIIGIAIGYFINKFYVIEQPAAPATTSTPPPTDETANWKTYRNEEYRFEMKYPKDWKVREVSSTNFLQAYGFEDFAKDTPIKFVAFKSPDTSTRKDFYYYLSFGLRRKGENILLSENTWKGLEKYARLGDSVKIGNIETKTTQFFIKDKPH